MTITKGVTMRKIVILDYPTKNVPACKDTGNDSIVYLASGAYTNGGYNEEKFLRTLRTARRMRPDVIEIRIEKGMFEGE